MHLAAEAANDATSFLSPLMSLQQKISQSFQHRFGQPPAFTVRAPGRVNLIGEHTDYNDGFVLSMAIDRAIWIALRPRSDRRTVAHAVDLKDTADFSLDSLQKTNQGWAEYLKGVAWSLQEAGYTLHGWEGVVVGDVPRGAGLSSSAALELATARAFSALSAFPWDPVEMARLSQRAENELGDVICRRARHVVTENARTLLAAEALERDYLREMGHLMNASHASLRNDFEVSSAELDTMTTCARQDDTCYGAHMTGAGFGGCAIAPVQADAAHAFSAQVVDCYQEATDTAPQILICKAAQGAEIVVGSRPIR